VAAGFGIGVVASLLGVAGGELLIPTLILLFGVEISMSSGVALAVSPFKVDLGARSNTCNRLSSLLLGVLVPIRSTQVAVRSTVVESHRAAEVRRRAFTTNAVHAISRKVVR